jgi:hypothetical protein
MAKGMCSVKLDSCHLHLVKDRADCAVFNACSGVTVGQADLPAMWCCPTSLKPVMKGQNSGIKMGDHERLES